MKFCHVLMLILFTTEGLMEFGINAYTDSAFKYDQWSHSQMLHYFFFVTDYAQKDMPF